jgi:hypothetical protein
MAMQQITIRLDEEDIEAIKEISNKAGVKHTVYARFLLKQALTNYDVSTDRLLIYAEAAEKSIQLLQQLAAANLFYLVRERIKGEAKVANETDEGFNARKNVLFKAELAKAMAGGQTLIQNFSKS